MDHRAFSSRTFLNIKTWYNHLYSNKTIFNSKIHRKENNFKSTLKFLQLCQWILRATAHIWGLFLFIIWTGHEDWHEDIKILYIFVLNCITTAKYEFPILDIILPDPLNWLLASVVGLVFPLFTGGENICKITQRYLLVLKFF